MQHSTNIKSFARRIGRPLRDAQKTLLNSLLPQFQITSWNDLVHSSSGYKTVSLEIGFGDGEFIFDYASKRSDNLSLGCEPFLNGVTSLLSKISSKNISNIRIFADDVRKLLCAKSCGFFDNVFVVCPDPWPKKRQQKRRLLNKDFVNLLADALKPDGKLYIVTDHVDYAGFILDALKSSAFCTEGLLDNFLLQESDWLFTKYQRRGIESERNIYSFVVTKLMANYSNMI